MSAIDEPIPYALTVEGRWAAARGSTWSLQEASRTCGMAPAYVLRLVRLGDVEGVEVDGQWLIDAGSLAGFMVGRVPAAPLLRQILLRRGDYACGVLPDTAERRALERARACGWVTVRAADRMACYVVRMSAWELWPDAC